MPVRTDSAAEAPYSAQRCIFAVPGLQRIGRVEEYLELNRGMHGLPVRRIVRTAGISGGRSGAFGGRAAAACFRTEYRFLSSGFFPAEPYGAAAQPETVMEEQPPGFEIPEELLGEEREPWFQIPPLCLLSLYALAVGGIAALILYGIYQIFKNFRSSYTDNRDVVQFLGNQEEEERLEGERRHSKNLRLGFFLPQCGNTKEIPKTILRGSKESLKTGLPLQSWKLERA